MVCAKENYWLVLDKSKNLLKAKAQLDSNDSGFWFLEYHLVLIILVVRHTFFYFVKFGFGYDPGIVL